MKRLVVARYKENLDWLKFVPSDVQVFVYNKNPTLVDPVIKEAVKYSNVAVKGLAMISPGHEAHTYLYHILSTYHNKFQPTVTYFVQGFPFDHTPTIIEDLNKKINGFDWLMTNWHYCDYNGCPHHCNLPIGNVAHDLFGETFTNELAFIPGAQFAVSTEMLLSHSYEYYETLAHKFETTHAQVWHWCAERLWRRIFTGEY